MISHINGRLVEKTPTYVVIECNGVGYQMNISLNTFGKIGESESCKLHTQFIVREDAQLLYGFYDKSEKQLFQLLISVSGIGPSTALMVLSSSNPLEVQEAIISGDVAWFKSVKGIGPKSAQRIIIDLKDKVALDSTSENISSTLDNTLKEEALSALVMLGFNKNQAEKSINKILRNSPEVGIEELIKIALKGL